MSTPTVPDTLLKKLGELEERFAELDTAIQDPDLFSNPDSARMKLKEHGRLKPMVDGYRAYKKAEGDARDTRELLEDEDEEMRLLAEAELPELEKAIEDAGLKLRELFVTQDEEAARDVIIEINAGVGGDEAALFAGDLFRMYARFAERKRWKAEVIDSADGKVGGLKRVTFTVEGDGVYRMLRFESGGHRVQRVPETETQGRIHTSMVTVVVLPQVEEVDVEIAKADVREDRFSASGPGGQHVNKTQSAIRLTHEPTGIVVSCQDEKSQHKNRDRAWKVLRARVSDHYKTIADKERGAQRQSLRGRGNRNERIRTYNFPQDRCTDHRIGFSIHGLPGILDGDFGSLIDKLVEHDKEEALKNL
jgi:peptide chain release factor 1